MTEGHTSANDRARKSCGLTRNRSSAWIPGDASRLNVRPIAGGADRMREWAESYTGGIGLLRASQCGLRAWGFGSDGASGSWHDSPRTTGRQSSQL